MIFHKEDETANALFSRHTIKGARPYSGIDGPTLSDFPVFSMANHSYQIDEEKWTKLRDMRSSVSKDPLFACSTQLSMKFSLLIDMKMPTITGIFIFISREIFMLSFV